MKSRATAIAVLLMMLLAACGARLTTAQRAAGINGLGGPANTTGTVGPAGGGKQGVGLGTSGSAGTGTGTTGTGTGAGTGGVGAAACGGSGPNTASDIGVTPTQITVATASDVSGVQAALFKSTFQAMQAWTAMVNNQGGLCGRGIKPLQIDTKADATANQAAVRQACDSAFALVGSMSAFDNGGADTGQRCGIPDLTAITVNGDREKATNVYPIYPVRPDKFAIGTANYIKQTYPTVIKHAAMVYLNAGVTKTNALQRVKAYEGVGFDFGPSNDRRIYEVQILEPNYGPYVQKMRDRGVEYVSMVANLQSIQKLLQAMDQAGWYPKVRDWDSVAYSPQFVLSNGQPYKPADGSLVFLNTNIAEEAAGNPEMQLYITWLSRVAVGAKPDYFGFYAWSAGRLFQKLAAEIGPKLTRKALLDAVKKVHAWDDNGLHAAQDVGNKIMSPCFMYLSVVNGRFTRKAPASGFICNKGGIVNT
jgi:ABC-type branched-subunit amino acid transport system substrate-binding protein